MIRTTLSVALCVLLGTCGNLYAPEDQLPKSSELRLAPPSLEDFQSVLDLLGDLASERYASNSQRNETWVITVHYGESIQKYTDGRYVVVSLPALTPTERSVMCGYANQYNCQNVKAADLLAQSGKYKSARELCQLVSHFGCAGAHITEEARKRLPLLEKLERGEDKEAAAKDLARLFVPYQSKHDFTQIGTLKATIVTNLMQISLEPRLQR